MRELGKHGRLGRPKRLLLVMLLQPNIYCTHLLGCEKMQPNLIRGLYMDNLQGGRHLTVPDDLNDSIGHLWDCEPIKAIPIWTSFTDTLFARWNVRP